MIAAFGKKRGIAQGTTTRTHGDIEFLEYQKPEFAEYVRAFMKRKSTSCMRCHGFMTHDGESSVVCRCVQCGDVVDPTILKNRTAMLLPMGKRRNMRSH